MALRFDDFLSVFYAVATAMLLALAAGCGRDQTALPPVDGKPRVVATISIIGDWVKIVGGDEVALQTFVGPDGDPHEYGPVPSDNITLAKADVLFENGLGLESWLDKLYQSSQAKAARVVITQGIEVRHVAESEGMPPRGKDTGRDDPHAWQNVQNAMVMVGNIRAALVKADPAHAAGYQARAEAYLQQLAALDAWVQDQINTLPKQRRKLVTSHDAFGYFGGRYGVDISRSALESVTTEASDPSAKQIVDVVRQIEAAGVPVIFLENIQNPQLMAQIATEAGVKVGPPLYSDALGQPGTAGDTYIKMIQYNVRTLIKALGQ